MALRVVRNGTVDVSSKIHLSKLPFKGKLLFGDALKELVKELGESKGACLSGRQGGKSQQSI